MYFTSLFAWRRAMKKSAPLLLAVLVLVTSSRAVLSQIPQEPAHAPDGGTTEFLTTASWCPRSERSLFRNRQHRVDAIP